jgi:hypothetical protein
VFAECGPRPPPPLDDYDDDFSFDLPKVAGRQFFPSFSLKWHSLNFPSSCLRLCNVGLPQALPRAAPSPLLGLSRLPHNFSSSSSSSGFKHQAIPPRVPLRAPKRTFWLAVGRRGCRFLRASFPRYMALAANQQFTDVVNGTLNGARAALVLTLTVMEGIINFLVDIYRSTFLCPIESIVRGTLPVLISAIQEVRYYHSGNIFSCQFNAPFTARSTFGSHRVSIAPTKSAIHAAVSGQQSRPFRAAPRLLSSMNFRTSQSPTIFFWRGGVFIRVIPDNFTQALANPQQSHPFSCPYQGQAQCSVGFRLFSDKSRLSHTFSSLDTPFELTKQDITDTFNNVSFKPPVSAVPPQSSTTSCYQTDAFVIDDLGRDLVRR